jgi:ureidoacrylate peracid hydrolase
MHKFTMPQQAVDRVLRRRGKIHAYDTLDAQRTALVVIDLQNAFMLEGVAHTLCEMAPKIVPNVNQLAGALREAGGLVVWIRTTAKAEALTSWSTYYDLASPEAKERRIAALTEGSIGHEFWAGLDRRAEDLVVTKQRFSAFIPGSSDLEAQLRARGIDTVLITGCVTNVCCESTARDAMMLNFKTVMVSDANAAANDQEHANALTAFYLNFGDVQTTDQLVAGLGASSSVRRAASA